MKKVFKAFIYAAFACLWKRKELPVKCEYLGANCYKSATKAKMDAYKSGVSANKRRIPSIAPRP